MKYSSILLLIAVIQCIDVCVQHTNYQNCIEFQNEQCQWFGQYCRWSNNYLFGCDPTLSEKLCMKQFGTLNGTVAECIFDEYCHTIYDKHSIKCTDKLSKSGCLSITNPTELCKWENGMCQYLSSAESMNIQKIFDQKELSASVCSQIDGYLIIHNSLLWNLVGYSPDLFQESENLVKLEAGLQIEVVNSYNESAILQDNFIDSNGKYQWYVGTTQSTVSNGRINDYERYGCIAQEILTENRFYMLFSLSGIIRGVNHIYCNYLGIHPSAPVLTFFTNSQCQPITEAQLQDQNYIEQNNIRCSSLERITCQKYYNIKQKCQIFQQQEYQCQNIDQIEQQIACEPNTLQATHFICAQTKSQPCYLDTSTVNAQCSQNCFNYTIQDDCESDSLCTWLGRNLNNLTQSTTSSFIVCSPLEECEQLGLNKYYCQYIASNCYWNEQIIRCQSIKLIEAYRCIDCNSLFCCSSIIRYDQFCIWKDEECLNVKDQPLYSHFLSFPEKTIMNYNLCVNQAEQYNYYNFSTRNCPKSNIDLYTECLQDTTNQQYDNQFIECNNPPNNSINMEGCLALINSQTKWDTFKQKCMQVIDSNVPCDEMKLVNPNICKHTIVDQDKYCFYNQDTFSCYSVIKSSINMKCDTNGINQEDCLNLNEQLCAWRSNKCQYLSMKEIFERNCYELSKVSASVCKYSTLDLNSCVYNFESHNCNVLSQSMDECKLYSNKYACRYSNEKCYFNNILNQCCSSQEYLNILFCDTEWISQSTCLNITTPGQRCMWDGQCKFYKQLFSTQCEATEVSNNNLNVCEAITSNIYLTFNDNQYCEVINQQCISSIDIISDNDCGYQRQMNQFRCMGYTSQLCYFYNYKCNLLDGPINYQNFLLKQLTCDQSNMQLCNQIQTIGQVCYKINSRKCIQVETTYSNSCSNLIEIDTNIYGPNICSKANDECYYDITMKKCAIPTSSMLFDCWQLGISKVVCTTMTRGACAFSNNFCQTVDINSQCSDRNKKACTIGNLKCNWDSSSQYCSNNSDSDCPENYQNGEDFPQCSLSSTTCYAGPNGCLNNTDDTLPCWLSLSQSLCYQQQSFCQWIDNACVNKKYKCEDSSTVEQCLFHRSLSCVYNNQQCYEIIDFNNYNCDDFEKTTHLFCRNYYPLCMYSKDNQTCTKINFFGDGIQFDSELSKDDCNGLQATYYSCILQQAASCSYENDYGFPFCSYPWNPRTSCEWYDTSNPFSIRLCQEMENCRFKMTSTGEPFCYTYPLQCENLDLTMCLLDIPDIKCYVQNGWCYTFPFYPILCDFIQNMQVNYQLCLEASKNSSPPCYYDNITNYCKFAENQGLIQQQLNDCVTQDNDYYFYNLTTQQCQQNYDQIENYNDIYYCFQLSSMICISIQNHLSCVLVDNFCQDYRLDFRELECEKRNYQACLISDLSCIWDSDKQLCQSQQSSSCTNCVYSEYYCISIRQLWDGLNCYVFNTELPNSFYQCEKLGLNQQLCLNNTRNLFCFWNGKKCLPANLKTQLCLDIVSQVTCLNIQTPQQICVWQDDQCFQKNGSYMCEDYQSLQNCRSALISCQYNLASRNCISIIDNLQYCYDTLSKQACLNVIGEICQWNQNQCQVWFRSRYSCENIFNYWGCQNTDMYCKWNDKCENIETLDFVQPKMTCQDIPQNFNKVSCAKYSIGPCRYDDKLGKCNINLTSDFENSLDGDQSSFIQIQQSSDCTQLYSLNDCVANRIGYCEWSQNECLNCESDSHCQQEGCANKSMLQCLSLSNVLCAWRKNSCVEWIQSTEITLSDLSLVSEKCCALQNMEIKYNLQLHSCLPLDYNSDDCLTPGLSRYACLKIQNFECVFDSQRCLQFKYKQEQRCSQYRNITMKVCQMIQNLSCKYDSINNSCVEIEDEDNCNVEGLSFYGCTQIKLYPCFWETSSQSCQSFQVELNGNQCDGSVKTNSVVCQLLNYQHDVCSYNFAEKSCQTIFNQYSKCNYPGLNRKACLNLKLEPCKYENNQCSKLKTLNDTCLNFSNVNELACKMNIFDNCAYNPITNSCFLTLSQVPCSYPGLNINNCKNQKNCIWSYDQNSCQCNSVTSSQKCMLNIDQCNKSLDCTYDYDFNICRIKTCSDLEDCQGIVNHFHCYLDSSKNCQNAQSCEDIINLDVYQVCTDFVFNFSNCIQVLNYCVSAYNLQKFCSNSDCSNSSCKMDDFYCRPLQCSDYKETECYSNSNCSFINNQCIRLQSCADISDQNICINTTINNIKCEWQTVGIFDQTNYCTNQYCGIFTNIPYLCNGNEINSYSCQMNAFSQCQTCEEIIDPCQCENNRNNFCIYQDEKCKSVLCSSYLSEKSCSASNKCYWSLQDQICRKNCIYLILEEDCDALNYECHWNPFQYQCEQGIAPDSDLSVNIQVQTIGSSILIISIFQILI